MVLKLILMYVVINVGIHDSKRENKKKIKIRNFDFLRNIE